ncbi:MAG: hypothetical protein H7222_15810 [Methylotenera sp.]|nr:hypothetical protein [Oligoflexia bacterium]
MGAPIYIRAFKTDSHVGALKPSIVPGNYSTLEVWMRTSEGTYELFQTYISRAADPKKQAGCLTPEGFYEAEAPLLNPNSSYKLSLDIGFPNQYDLSHNLHAQLLVVNGKKEYRTISGSIACYNLSQPQVEEIYSIMDESLNQNETLSVNHHTQPYVIPFHSFSMRMDGSVPKKVNSQETSEVSALLQNASGLSASMREGYKRFQTKRIPPAVSVVGSGTGSNYHFTDAPVSVVRRRCAGNPHGLPKRK